MDTFNSSKQKNRLEGPRANRRKKPEHQLSEIGAIQWLRRNRPTISEAISVLNRFPNLVHEEGFDSLDWILRRKRETPDSSLETKTERRKPQKMSQKLARCRLSISSSSSTSPDQRRSGVPKPSTCSPFSSPEQKRAVLPKVSITTELGEDVILSGEHTPRAYIPKDVAYICYREDGSKIDNFVDKLIASISGKFPVRSFAETKCVCSSFNLQDVVASCSALLFVMNDRTMRESMCLEQLRTAEFLKIPTIFIRDRDFVVGWNSSHGEKSCSDEKQLLISDAQPSADRLRRNGVHSRSQSADIKLSVHPKGIFSSIPGGIKQSRTSLHPLDCQLKIEQNRQTTTEALLRDGYNDAFVIDHQDVCSTINSMVCRLENVMDQRESSGTDRKEFHREESTCKCNRIGSSCSRLLSSKAYTGHNSVQLAHEGRYHSDSFDNTDHDILKMTYDNFMEDELHVREENNRTSLQTARNVINSNFENKFFQSFPSISPLPPALSERNGSSSLPPIVSSERQRGILGEVRSAPPHRSKADRVISHSERVDDSRFKDTTYIVFPPRSDDGTDVRPIRVNFPFDDVHVEPTTNSSPRSESTLSFTDIDLSRKFPLLTYDSLDSLIL